MLCVCDCVLPPSAPPSAPPWAPAEFAVGALRLKINNTMPGSSFRLAEVEFYEPNGLKLPVSSATQIPNDGVTMTETTGPNGANWSATVDGDYTTFKQCNNFRTDHQCSTVCDQPHVLVEFTFAAPVVVGRYNFWRSTHQGPSSWEVGRTRLPGPQPLPGVHTMRRPGAATASQPRLLGRPDKARLW